MSRYSVRRVERTVYRVVKFDDDLNVENIYLLRLRKRGSIQGYQARCECFQSRQPSCRHRVILREFFLSSRVDTGWFYDYERGQWHRPLVKYVKK